MVFKIRHDRVNVCLNYLANVRIGTFKGRKQSESADVIVISPKRRTK